MYYFQWHFGGQLLNVIVSCETKGVDDYVTEKKYELVRPDSYYLRSDRLVVQRTGWLTYCYYVIICRRLFTLHLPLDYFH